MVVNICLQDDVGTFVTNFCAVKRKLKQLDQRKVVLIRYPSVCQTIEVLCGILGVRPESSLQCIGSGPAISTSQM